MKNICLKAKKVIFYESLQIFECLIHVEIPYKELFKEHIYCNRIAVILISLYIMSFFELYNTYTYLYF